MRRFAVFLNFLAIYNAAASFALAADAASTVNFSYNHCSLPEGIMSRTFTDFFESTPNIFEGEVISTSAVPNRNASATNECWAKLRVTRWYKSNVDQSEVAAIFDTDPADIPSDFSGAVYCPASKGQTLLIFANEYKKESGTGNTSFTLHNRCSMYLPIHGAGLWRNLLRRWVELESLGAR